MDIYFSDLKRTNIIQLPIIPPDMPELSQSAKNEEFESYEDGVYNLLGNVGLVSFSIDCWLPQKSGKYPFQKGNLDNPYDLINLWRSAMESKTPIRCVMTRNINDEILNWMVTVEQMSWHETKTRDIAYKVDFKQYREV